MRWKYACEAFVGYSLLINLIVKLIMYLYSFNHIPFPFCFWLISHLKFKIEASKISATSNSDPPGNKNKTKTFWEVERVQIFLWQLLAKTSSYYGSTWKRLPIWSPRSRCVVRLRHVCFMLLINPVAADFLSPVSVQGSSPHFLIRRRLFYYFENEIEA